MITTTICKNINETLVFVSEIFNFTLDDLMNIKNMGKKTAELIYEYICSVEFKVANEALNEVDEADYAIASEISSCFKMCCKKSVFSFSVKIVMGLFV